MPRESSVTFRMVEKSLVNSSAKVGGFSTGFGGACFSCPVDRDGGGHTQMPNRKTTNTTQANDRDARHTRRPTDPGAHIQGVINAAPIPSAAMRHVNTTATSGESRAAV